MLKYTTKGVPNTPLVRVMSDGVSVQEFTSLSAAKAWIEHAEFLHKAWRDDVAAYGDQCQCYGCVTMRRPCVKETR